MIAATLWFCGNGEADTRLDEWRRFWPVKVWVLDRLGVWWTFGVLVSKRTKSCCEGSWWTVLFRGYWFDSWFGDCAGRLDELELGSHVDRESVVKEFNSCGSIAAVEGLKLLKALLVVRFSWKGKFVVEGLNWVERVGIVGEVILMTGEVNWGTIGRINDLEHFESNVLSCNVLLLSVISVMIDGLLCLLCGCG